MNINAIRKQLVEASHAYYNNNESIISDAQFDKLKDNLKSINPHDPVLITIGAKVPKNSAWKKGKHEVTMGSLDKVNTKEEFLKWYMARFGKEVVTIVPEKLDGISIELNYVDGDLVSAITRGDGYEGEVITPNVLKMQNVRSKVRFKYTGSLYGEVMLTQSDFITINGILEMRGEEPVKNTRNGASGIAKGRDGEFCEWLTVLYYDCTGEYDTEMQKYEFMKKIGVIVCPYEVCQTAEEVWDVYNLYVEKFRDECGYDIDGLVVKVVNCNVQKSLGRHDLNPKYAIAIKFPNMSKKTHITGVTWQLGKSGRLTPVAELDPIKLGGVTISRASLSNAEIFSELDLHYGDIVVVERANDVIPHILENTNMNIDEDVDPWDIVDIEQPYHCPVCREALIVNGKFLECQNEMCRGKSLGRLKKWADKAFGDAKGLGKKTIEKFHAMGLITEPNDFYQLGMNDIQYREGFGKRKAEIILNVIASGKEVTLPQFIGGLNISNFGERMTKHLVAAGYDTLDKILSITEAQLVSVQGIESKTAQCLLKGLEDRAGLIKDLLNVNVTIIKPKEKVVSMSGDSLSGMSFCFTGAIQKLGDDGKRFTRGLMEDVVEENGGKVGKVKAGLTYLVQADPSSQSSKTKKAVALGIEILSEADFFAMVE